MTKEAIAFEIISDSAMRSLLKTSILVTGSPDPYLVQEKALALSIADGALNELGDSASLEEYMAHAKYLIKDSI